LATLSAPQSAGTHVGTELLHVWSDWHVRVVAPDSVYPLPAPPHE
jgi:hypothetical protein